MGLPKVVLGAMLLFAPLASAQLAITPDRLPNPALGGLYNQDLRPNDGAAPFRWSVRGRLPVGITFDPATAKLTGIATTPGDYRFTITLADSSRRTVSRQYLLHVGDGTTITIAWTKNPAVADGRISGEVEVANSGREAFDLTFIAVAVNEIGRATALGYQRFSLGQGKRRIPFGMTLPHGTYVVHADAVGEIAPTLTIRRARLQSPPLSIP